MKASETIPVVKNEKEYMRLLNYTPLHRNRSWLLVPETCSLLVPETCSFKKTTLLHHASDWHVSMEVSMGLKPSHHNLVLTYRLNGLYAHYQAPHTQLQSRPTSCVTSKYLKEVKPRLT